MATAHTKPVPRNMVPSAVYADESFTFHNMVSRLLNGDGGSGSSPLSRTQPSAGSEFTVRGRHQWDMND
jgi:hypothetical protein